jgi:hypothetical protein
MIKIIICFFIYINNAMANVDIVVNELYEKVDKKILNEIFISKENVKDILINIDNVYDINLLETQTFADLNKQIQKKLIRGRGVERADLRSKNKNLCDIDTFNKSKLLKNQNINKLIPVILGATFDTMSYSINSVLNAGIDNNFITLVSDRPITPEDFNAEVRTKMMYETLCKKRSEYKGKYKQIEKIINDYIVDNNIPVIKRIILYANLVNLIDKKNGKIARNLVDEIMFAIKKYGFTSKEYVSVMLKYRDFLYNNITEILPTEKNMAEYIFESHKIKDVVFIFTKTKFKTQDRATTIDTYYDFIDYINKNNADISKFILININNYPYRQWLEFILMLDKKQSWPQFASVSDKIDCNSNDIFVDEFARLFYDFSKIIK